MKIHSTLLIFVFPVAIFLTGCASNRGLYDAGAGAAGAGVGYMASGGDPIATIGGAAGGVLISEGIQASVSNAKRNEYNRGYDRGGSDAAKRLYWAQLRAKEPSTTTKGQLRYNYYEVPTPTTVQTPQGTIYLTNSTVAVPVVETQGK
ncbi:MAG: hypothetical protein SFY92_00740 [Verrucomicrobiae bacterium]|nr:hypothetical protein [Verrucomicrobiae bacterium]